MINKLLEKRKYFEAVCFLKQDILEFLIDFQLKYFYFLPDKTKLNTFNPKLLRDIFYFESHNTKRLTSNFGLFVITEILSTNIDKFYDHKTLKFKKSVKSEIDELLEKVNLVKTAIAEIQTLLKVNTDIKADWFISPNADIEKEGMYPVSRKVSQIDTPPHTFYTNLCAAKEYNKNCICAMENLPNVNIIIIQIEKILNAIIGCLKFI